MYCDVCIVCGFEAFINGKHIVGEVKEKEQAHREYREAISQGHGAYLMDEETPVRNFLRALHYVCTFTVSDQTYEFELPQICCAVFFIWYIKFDSSNLPFYCKH